MPRSINMALQVIGIIARLHGISTAFFLIINMESSINLNKENHMSTGNIDQNNKAPVQTPGADNQNSERSAVEKNKNDTAKTDQDKNKKDENKIETKKI